METIDSVFVTAAPTIIPFGNTEGNSCLLPLEVRFRDKNSLGLRLGQEYRVLVKGKN